MPNSYHDRTFDSYLPYDPYPHDLSPPDFDPGFLEHLERTYAGELLPDKAPHIDALTVFRL